jgi:flagellar biosynthetic protein FlhB
MAEDQGEKTEAPTPRRRQEARDQGQIARSPDLAAAALLLASLLMLNSYGPGMVNALQAMVHKMLSQESMQDVIATDALGDIVSALVSMATALMPLLGCAVVVAIVVNIIQVGFVFNAERLAPNFAALNPTRGFSKLFSGGAGPAKLALSFLKVLLLAGVGYSAVHGRLFEIVTVQQLSFIQIFVLGSQIVFSIGIRMGIVMLILAIIDYCYQRYHLEQQLKMSKQEVKEEMRRMDGDPRIKQRRKQIAKQIHRRRLKKTVPTADVVVTNPTEFAVALKYDANSMNAPRVIAKGRGVIAAHIRALAIEAGVPILERPPLARALYKMVEVGQEVPEQFYTAIAEILAYVYELSKKLKRKERAA